MADFSEPAAQPADIAADDRMRLLLGCAVVAFLSVPALAAPDADTLLSDDFEERIRRLSTGELRFLPTAPDRPVHHHLTRVEITPEALESGWVVLNQCHDHLDPVPATQIVYRPGTLRRLEIVGYRNIESARVEGDSVQLTNVGADAKLCLAAETRSLHSVGEGVFELRNGPFMRRFLDGYFPMRVSLEVKYPDGLELVETEPPAQAGFEVRRAGQWVMIEAVFEGRLGTVLRFRTRPVAPSP
jgi:hypothetical protein